MQDLRVFLAKWQKIIAITPYYMENGRTGCIVRYDNSEIEKFDCRCERLVEALANKFNVTLEQVRLKSIMWLGKGALRKPPLLLNENFCLIQVKCRAENQRNSGTLGYVVLRKVLTVLFHANAGSQVLFHKKGYLLEITQKKESVDKQLQMGKLLVEKYRNEQLHDATTKF